MFRKTVTLAIALLVAMACFAQNPAPSDARGVLRLRVRVKIGDSTRGLSRKRFFLIKGSLEQNKSLLETIAQKKLISRDCYYSGIGASPALIRWLHEGDCESVYCREVVPDDLEGPGAVPEFEAALRVGEKEFGSGELARKWLTVNLPENIRDGFYKSRQQELQALIKQFETTSGTVLSVMTDRNGTAYFTDLEPGTYVVSNLLPTEVGNTGVTWNCQMEVKPGDLATEKPFMVSNRADRNVKCVGIEKPLPACDSTRSGNE